MYVVYVRERYNSSLMYMFKKGIKDVEVKVDVQEGP